MLQICIPVALTTAGCVIMRIRMVIIRQIISVMKNPAKISFKTARMGIRIGILYDILAMFYLK
jgi:hypothetical protein